MNSRLVLPGAFILGMVLQIAGLVPVTAQTFVPAPLSAQVRANKDGFQPISPEHVAAARAHLDWALYNLDMSLFSSGEQNRGLWWNFLKWTELKEQLAKPEPDLAVLQGVVSQLRKNENGLEQPVFTAARDALKSYVTLLEVTADKDMAAAFQEHIEQLATELDTLDREPTVDNLLAVGRSVGWFEKRRQIPAVVSAIRYRYQQDNIQVFVSERLLSRNINRCINESTNVNDCILGTTICGSATMNGQATLRMIPCAAQAQLDIFLQGCIYSDTVGYNRSVQIYATGTTNVVAHKMLYLTPNSLIGAPTEAHCETQTNINNITASKLPRLITKIAWKKAGKQLPQAQAIAAEKAEEKVEAQLDEQSVSMIERQNQELIEMKYPLVRNGSLPQRMSFSSTNQELVAHILRWGVGQLSANGPPPATSTPWDITAQVHETAVVNYGEAFLSNYTLTDENLARMLKERTGEVPAELQPSEDKDPWSITFADFVPVRAKFQDNIVSLAIRGKRFTRGDQKINDLIEIAAAYRVELTPNGSKLLRVGDVTVDYVGRKGPQGAQQVTFKTFLRRKFEALFKPEFENEGMELTGKASRIGDKLQTKHAVFQNAWATVGMNSVPKTPKAAKPAAVNKEFVDPNDRAANLPPALPAVTEENSASPPLLGKTVSTVN